MIKVETYYIFVPIVMLHDDFFMLVIAVTTPLGIICLTLKKSPKTIFPFILLVMSTIRGYLSFYINRYILLKSAPFLLLLIFVKTRMKTS